ncbi:MAG: adenylyltransferase/cytidyltransferase family protein [Victivallales bacterium]|nr:adenylyltransferase/cytidyltransferase family protein [Victivallales bacterium]
MSTQDEQEQLPFQERRPDRSPLRPRDFGSSEDSLENGEGTRRPFKYSRHENTEGRREYRPRFRSEQDGEDGVRRPRFHRNQDGEGDGFRPRFSRERGEDREEPGPVPRRRQEDLPQENEPVQPTTVRLAIFGGAFDPIHNGHIQIARQILEKDLATEILFVPALDPPHKQEQTMAMPVHRLEMVRLALQNQPPLQRTKTVLKHVENSEEPVKVIQPILPQFGYSDIELRRMRRSYTYDTMTTLKQIYPDYELVFIIGMDSLRTLSTWYRAAELVQHSQFLVYPRPEVPPPAFIDLAKSFGARNANRLLESVLDEYDFPVSPISSTDIRVRIAAGQPVTDLLPEAVWNYIQEHQLYR